MSFASGRDLEALREVGRIVATTLEQVSRYVAPGVTTARLDRYAESILAEHGARSAPRLHYGFPGTICISVNEEIVHGVPGDREIGEGDIVKLDVTAQKAGWIADGARSILVPPVPERLGRLLECAVAALGEALAVARAGNSVRQIGRVV
jgi:methionyl aminopeptidase